MISEERNEGAVKETISIKQNLRYKLVRKETHTSPIWRKPESKRIMITTGSFSKNWKKISKSDGERSTSCCYSDFSGHVLGNDNCDHTFITHMTQNQTTYSNNYRCRGVWTLAGRQEPEDGLTEALHDKEYSGYLHTRRKWWTNRSRIHLKLMARLSPELLK